MNHQKSGTVYLIAVVAVLGLLAVVGDNTAYAQLRLPSLPGGVGQLPVDRLGDRVRRTQKDVEPVIDEAVEQASNTVDVVDEATGEIVGVASNLVRTFIPDTDIAGAPIEADILVAFVDAEQLADLGQSGYEILARRDMTALGLTMVTLERPAGLSMSGALEGLRSAVPGIRADFNHIYRANAEIDQLPSGSLPAAAPSPAAGDLRLRIGIIDSDVMPSHRALEAIEIIRKDFVSHDALRPQTHGTAVSSLVARAARNNVQLLSASVFFQAGNYAPGATTESLVAALDWLAGEKVDVINMSLAGPGNQLLELAVESLRENGPVIVAAVGNNGPASEPLYPAAYDGTIGVTAVDRDERVFRYANRGDYVDCAALGVNVKVADSTTGGWRIESGTSMASPYIAVVVAQMLRTGNFETGEVMDTLVANAKDLGPKGFDRTYGYGLVTHIPEVISSN